ncbi:MAG: hypothetical protein GC160_18690 [Acidobacteria bacterium]|nr:hypothetical protein [Acidobacteriota bacterium]
MGTEQIYAHCRSAVGGLLSAMDAHDVRGIEDELGRLRGYLSTREALPPPRLDRLFEERLDALEGVVDAIQSSVQVLRLSADQELSRIREAAPLLRHLTTS